jgi:hypothetical protein
MTADCKSFLFHLPFKDFKIILAVAGLRIKLMILRNFKLVIRGFGSAQTSGS